MSAFSSWFEQAIGGWINGVAIATTPTALELRLHTASPLDDYSGAAEVGGGLGYVAQVITLTLGGAIVGTGSTLTNNNLLVFGPATGAWGSITHWSIHGTAGDLNFYFYGAFLAAKAIIAGDSYTVPIGTLDILIR